MTNSFTDHKLVHAHHSGNSNPADRRLLITAALPYANGPIHLGHMLEHIQTDVWSRVHKMAGHQVYFVCAEDAHGTPIMLKAQQEKITPEQLVEKSWHAHKNDFDGFSIAFDLYYTTHSSENEALAGDFYQRLKDNDLITQKLVEQAYDPEAAMFLPDRFIKGKCPKCESPDQYGDACEKCGAVYSPTDLIDAYSVISGAAPIKRESTHYFFKLSDSRCYRFLDQWVEGLAQRDVIKKLREWLRVDEQGKSQLNDWDISRDAPYFGFEIPDTPGKFFYVWMDAPIGYFASFQVLCKRLNVDFDEWTRADSTTEQYHFVGKDIFYFHALFWPAMLKFAGYRPPTDIFLHGFLTINGQKMSKSRGTFITAKSYLDSQLDPDALRYYYCAKLNSSVEDIDLNFDDFVQRTNSDLVGKYVNIASRTAGFLAKKFDNKIDDRTMQHPLLVNIRQAIPAIKQLFEKREYSQALRQTMALADTVNIFTDTEKPWKLARLADDDIDINQQLHLVCSVCLEAFRLLTIALKPVVPTLAKRVESFLNIAPLDWQSVDTPLQSARPLKIYEHLMQRIAQSQIDLFVSLNKAKPA